MPKEIFYLFAIFCLAGGVRLTVILIRGIKQRRNRRRIQQEIAKFCQAAVHAKQSGSRPEIEDVEKATINVS